MSRNIMNVAYVSTLLLRRYECCLCITNECHHIKFEIKCTNILKSHLIVFLSHRSIHYLPAAGMDGRAHRVIVV